MESHPRFREWRSRKKSFDIGSNGQYLDLWWGFSQPSEARLQTASQRSQAYGSKKKSGWKRVYQRIYQRKGMGGDKRMEKKLCLNHNPNPPLTQISVLVFRRSTNSSTIESCVSIELINATLDGSQFKCVDSRNFFVPRYAICNISTNSLENEFFEVKSPHEKQKDSQETYIISHSDVNQRNPCLHKMAPEPHQYTHDTNLILPINARYNIVHTQHPSISTCAPQPLPSLNLPPAT